ncbi:hypothetical protein TYRP_019546 [Tyrophagus putrescentiae]|nr:hypothetical protein TYRP_019546 [Tyrophagus putrescentiae]
MGVAVTGNVEGLEEGVNLCGHLVVEGVEGAGAGLPVRNVVTGLPSAAGEGKEVRTRVGGGVHGVGDVSITNVPLTFLHLFAFDCTPLTAKSIKGNGAQATDAQNGKNQKENPSSPNEGHLRRGRLHLGPAAEKVSQRHRPQWEALSEGVIAEGAVQGAGGEDVHLLKEWQTFVPVKGSSVPEGGHTSIGHQDVAILSVLPIHHAIKLKPGKAAQINWLSGAAVMQNNSLLPFFIRSG